MVKLTTKLERAQQEHFFEYLDSLPDEERPVFAFIGRKAGLWHQLGGGTAQMIVLIYEHWTVISKRGMANAKKEISRVLKPLAEVADVQVINGPLFSSVQFRFADGSTAKIVNVDHAAAHRMEAFHAEGLRAFGHDRIDGAAAADFFAACLFGLPLPDDFQL